MTPRIDTPSGAPQVVPLAAWRQAHGLAPVIRAARPDEAATLTALGLRAKASLGLAEDVLRQSVPALTIAAETIAAGRVLVATDAILLGVAAHSLPVDGTADLTLLCVEPRATGRGVGRALFTAIAGRLRAQGIRRMAILSDRGAAAFYRRLGAVPTGFAPGVAGRMLPSLLLELI